MFLQDAAVHDHEDACLSRLFRSLLVDYSLLHPYDRNFQPDRLIDNFPHKFRTAEDVQTSIFSGTSTNEA